MLLALLCLSLAGCGAPSEQAEELVGDNTHGHGETATSTSARSLPSEALTVAQLGAELGCEPKQSVKAADFRQATCATKDASVTLLDFDTADGQTAWLDYALSYGGTYLVGDRWTLTTESKDYLTKLQDRFGGAIKGGA